jgi:hypothetical protein
MRLPVHSRTREANAELLHQARGLQARDAHQCQPMAAGDYVIVPYIGIGLA